MYFSVIVPIYGVEKYIHKCVDSILAQTFTDFELILVDDGSKDNCPAICDEYAKEDCRVRVIHKENGRLVSTRNAGIRAAVGDYICYVDGDDWVTEDWLSTIRDCIENAPEKPDIIAFDAVKVMNDGNVDVSRSIPAGYYDKARMETELYPYLISDRRIIIGREGIYPAAWNKAYKRELLTAHHCMNESITRGEDTSFTIECFLYAHNAVVCDRKLYFYNKLNPTSNLTKYDTSRVRAYAILFEYLKEHISGKYECIDRQLNDLYACYNASVLTHEVEHHPSLPEASRNIRKQYKEHDIRKYVSPRGLPFTAWLLVVLVKMNFMWAALIGCKIWLSRKQHK